MGMKIQYRVVPTLNNDVGGDEVYLGVSTEEPGELLLQKTDNPSPSAGYTDTAEEVHPRGKEMFAFCFWNVSNLEGTPLDIFTSEDLVFTLTKTPTEDVVATAWYMPVGGPDGQLSPPSVLTMGFDRTVNRFFRATPIQGVTPGNAWGGGEEHRVLTTESDVTIDARNGMNVQIVDKTHLFFESGPMFETWRMRGVKPEGDNLSVAQRASGFAVAVYQQRVFGHVINTIPYWLFKLLHGIIDADVINHIKHPPHPEFRQIERPALAVDDIVKVLRRLDRDSLGLLRDHALAASESARTVAELSDRVASMGKGIR